MSSSSRPSIGNEPQLMVVEESMMAERVSDIFVGAANEAIGERGLFASVLSGGSTPRPLYRLLAERHSRAQFWRSTHIFFGDERCVPPNDPESNYGMIADLLLSQVNIPEENIHRWKGEIDPNTAAKEYADEITSFLALKPQQMPVFDLVLLGMGEDGHIASIFPGASIICDTTGVTAATYVPVLDSYRLTLTPPVLTNARQIVFLVTGEDKADTLRQVLEGPYQPRHLPAQILKTAKGRVTWVVDTGAASLLS